MHATRGWIAIPATTVAFQSTHESGSIRFLPAGTFVFIFHIALFNNVFKLVLFYVHKIFIYLCPCESNECGALVGRR